MKIVNVVNFELFDELYKKYEQKKDANDSKNMLLLFVASNDPQTKQSWCSDCRNCKPVINKIIDEFKFNEQLALAIVEVGEQNEWKNSDNPFRSHKLLINAVPTLINLKNGMRLVEAECTDDAKVSHLFSNSM